MKTEKELAQIYNSSKININVTEQGINNINYGNYLKYPQVQALITDEMNDLYSFWKLGKLEVYNNIDDLVE